MSYCLWFDGEAEEATALSEMLGSSDKPAAQRAFSAMLEMMKLDLPALRRAHEGAGSSAEAAG